MATQYVEDRPVAERGVKRTAELVGTSTMFEAFVAAGAVVLAIIGLAGLMPHLLMAVGTILIGAAILLQGAAVSARYHKLIREYAEPGLMGWEDPDGGVGLSAESLAGLAGIVLGILALIGFDPVTLCAVALIAFGAAELLGSAATSRNNATVFGRRDFGDSTQRVISEAVHVSAGGQILAGLGAVVLGILSLLGFLPTTLALIGVLAIGCSLLITGSAIGARALGIVRHS
jgi:hypothetical protein